jgi:hypothetical protein
MWWTISAAGLASLTALVIAFGAYRWQKQQDRKLQLQLEKRRAYDEFPSAASEYFTALIMARNMRNAAADVLGSGNAFHFDMEKRKTSLACYGVPDVLEQCYRYADCLDIYRSHLDRELNATPEPPGCDGRNLGRGTYLPA